MATELSDWFLHNWDLNSYPIPIEKFKMAARFAQPTEAETVALLEKATQENTQKNIK